MPAQELSIAVVTDSGEMSSRFHTLVTWCETLHLAYAWASSNNGKASHWCALDRKKLKRALIGIHFFQTEPFVLEELAKERSILKVIADPEGIFHPKIAIGLRGDEAMILLGSSNFTKGGFGANTEVNVQISGTTTTPAIEQLLRRFDDLWHSARAVEPDAEWLAQYRVAFLSRPKPPPFQSPKGGKIESTRIRSALDIEVGWDRFYELIAAQERRTLANGCEIHIFDHPDGSYLQEAELCHSAFVDHPRFADMPLELRKLVAGFGGGTSGFFGRMGGAGHFKKLVIHNPEKVGAFLDNISLESPDPVKAARTYLLEATKVQGVSLATATRLLTVKRPDRFLTLNGANARRIREVFGKCPTSADAYFKLHERLWRMPWYDASAPNSADERRVWSARVGLLDALLYEAKE